MHEKLVGFRKTSWARHTHPGASCSQRDSRTARRICRDRSPAGAGNRPLPSCPGGSFASQVWEPARGGAPTHCLCGGWVLGAGCTPEPLCNEELPLDWTQLSSLQPGAPLGNGKLENDVQLSCVRGGAPAHPLLCLGVGGAPGSSRTSPGLPRAVGCPPQSRRAGCRRSEGEPAQPQMFGSWFPPSQPSTASGSGWRITHTGCAGG